ncbi:Histone_H2A [Hexamita inflata]|uniref:Histone H2A n=1 Tax=Hexamita inflata TaxID=28002 RepID=A0AA86TRQ9_9EUKA|nr:Histone H2A [Hexamita inflata]
MAAAFSNKLLKKLKEAETCKDNSKVSTKRLVVPNNILTAIRKDKELNDIFKDTLSSEKVVSPRSEKKEKSEKRKKSQE